MDTTPEEYDQVLRVGLLGQIHGVKAVLPHFLRNDMGGALVCVTSVEAVRPLPYHSGYSAAKHGVHGFLQALRLELAHDKLPIRVTEVMPASVDTPFFDKARTKIGERPQGAPPIYPPHLVADEIIRAAGSDLREVVIGGAGKAMVAGQRLSPTLMDAFMGLFGFAGQKTGIPKSADEPDNLYGPVQGYEQVEGSITGNRFATASRRITDVTSAATKPLRSNPMVTAALLGTAAVATAALLANRAKSQGEQQRASRPEGGNGAWDSYSDRLGSVGRMVDAHYGPGRPDPLHGDGGVLRRPRVVENL
jgi:hypothetical protein